jgi:hypothetical protein
VGGFAPTKTHHCAAASGNGGFRRAQSTLQIAIC